MKIALFLRWFCSHYIPVDNPCIAVKFLMEKRNRRGIFFTKTRNKTIRATQTWGPPFPTFSVATTSLKIKRLTFCWVHKSNSHAKRVPTSNKIFCNPPFSITKVHETHAKMEIMQATKTHKSCVI